MFLDDFISFLKPYSVEFGTTNPDIDLLIVCGILGMLCLLFVIKVTLDQVNHEPGIMSRLLFPTQDLKPLGEIRTSMDRVLNELEILKQGSLQDFGYIVQEVELTKDAVREVENTLSVPPISRKKTVKFKPRTRNKSGQEQVFRKSA